MSAADGTTGGSYDALQVAARCVPAAWVYVTDVQSWLGDIDAAIDDGQWSVSISASLGAVRSVVLCHLVLGGLAVPATEQELDVHAALDAGGCASLLTKIVSARHADRTTAESIAEQVREFASQLEEQLPVRPPVIRTSRGFFPSVRMGKDLAALRERLGLPAMDWVAWM